MPTTHLRADLIRLAHANPSLRDHILPLVLGKTAEEHGPGSVWKTESGNWRAKNEKGEAKSFGENQDAAKVHAGKAPKAPKAPKGDDGIQARRPSLSDDLKNYGADATVDKLKPEHREEIEGYDITVVGNDAAQAVEVARKIKQGIQNSADICKMNPPVCEGNKGLTRDKMPQISDSSVKDMLKATKKDGSPDEETRAKAQAMIQAGADPKSNKTTMQAMIDHFKSNGVQTKRTKIPVGMLKATQSEIKASKTYSMANNHLQGKFPTIGDSVVVSRDGHILDGHHRWAALLTIDPSREMNVQVIDMDMDDLLREAQAVPGVYKADFEGNPLPEAEQKKYKAEAKSKFKKVSEGKTAGFSVQASYNQTSDNARTRMEQQLIRMAHDQPNLRSAMHPLLAHIRNDREVRAFVARAARA